MGFAGEESRGPSGPCLVFGHHLRGHGIPSVLEANPETDMLAAKLDGMG